MKVLVAAAVGLAYVLMDYYVPNRLWLRLSVAGLTVFVFFYVYSDITVRERLLAAALMLVAAVMFFGLRAVRRSRQP